MLFPAVRASGFLGSYVYHCSESVVLNLGQSWQLPYQGHVARCGDIFGCHSWWWHLVSRGQMLLKHLTLSHHTQQRIVYPKMSVVLRWRNPAINDKLIFLNCYLASLGGLNLLPRN